MIIKQIKSLWHSSAVAWECSCRSKVIGLLRFPEDSNKEQGNQYFVLDSERHCSN